MRQTDTTLGAVAIDGPLFSGRLDSVPDLSWLHAAACVKHARVFVLIDLAFSSAHT